RPTRSCGPTEGTAAVLHASTLEDRELRGDRFALSAWMKLAHGTPPLRAYASGRRRSTHPTHRRDIARARAAAWAERAPGASSFGSDAMMRSVSASSSLARASSPTIGKTAHATRV